MFASGAKPNPCKLNHLSPPLSRARLEEEGREGGRRISLEESIALCAFKRRRKWKRRREGGERERDNGFPFPSPSFPRTSPLCFPVLPPDSLVCLSFSPLTHADWSGWRGNQPTPFTLCRRPYFFPPFPPSPRYSFFPPPFSRTPRPIQQHVAAFLRPRETILHQEPRDIDVLTLPRGVLWIGSFAYRPVPLLNFRSLDEEVRRPILPNLRQIVPLRIRVISVWARTRL